MEGQTLQHYRIAERIGKGGMGEVYRATDTKLNRDVAIKVIPDLFAKDPDRMARFSREAQVLASLNHPNIAAIHGLEESEGKRALVMELVDGETLQERIKRGAVPVEEALKYAKQIAEALEEAHEHGFIHRDLKPANIKITSNGTVKVLDFGLAKALEGEGSSGSSPDLSQSPTLSAAATAAGVILGTAAYMSPEQARGQKVDRRGDIWSFGVVLYEMLTGQSVYSGETVSDVLAKVLEREPDWDSLPKDTPASTERLLRRCFEKNVRQRLQSMGDARIVIDEYLSNPAAESTVIAGPATSPAQAPWVRVLPWALAGLAAAAFLAALAMRPSLPEASVVRLNAEVSNTGLFSDVGSAVVVSPDGTRLAYVVGDGNSRNLHIRSLDQLEGAPLSGTEQSYHPFFSPDGKWVGFVTRTELKKVSVSGGAPLTLAEANLSRGASWGPDETIVFAPTPGAGLSFVPSAGGEPKVLTELGDEETSHRWPQYLPDGKAVLFTSHASSRNFDDANIEAVVVATGERKVLHRGGSYARYVPSGHLVYVREGTLFGAPFDARRLEMTGSPAPILEDVISSPFHGSAQFDVAQNGLLVYLGGTLDRFQYSMVWADRDAKTLPVSPDRKTFGEPHISPDGSLLAVQVHDVGGLNVDIWVYDLKRGASTRLTFQEAADVAPIWSHDGKRVAFSSDRDGAFNIYWKRADGSGDVERLTESDNTQYVSSFSPAGKYLIYHESASGTAADLFVLPLEGDRKPELFLRTPFGESEAAFSPDGRWVAYNSNESGSSEVYVRPFPAGAGKWQISIDGGVYPRWAGQGRELFYRKDNALMLVSYRSDGDTFVAETPRKLFEGPFLSLSVGGMTLADYDVAPDGKRFVMMQGEEHVQEMKVTFVFNWFDDLRRTFSGGSD